MKSRFCSEGRQLKLWEIKGEQRGQGEQRFILNCDNQFHCSPYSLCSLEYEDHRPLYDWFIEKLEIFPSHQYEFARLNLTYTVMSKRKLLELVKNNYVRGWDDPRMPTICGMRRRGYPAAAIRKFCEGIGVTKYISNTDMSILEQAVREELNKTAPRYLGVFDPVKLVIDNYPDNEEEFFTGINNPEDPSVGERQIPFSKELWVERADFMKDPPKKFYRLAIGREVRLRYACLFTCTHIVEDENGKLLEIHGTMDLESRGGTSPDGRVVRGTIHWVSAKHAVELPVRLYDRLFSVEDPLADSEKDFLEFLNPDSLVNATVLAEPAVADLAPGAQIQFERMGYFCADSKDSAPGKLVFNRSVELKDSYKK